MKTQAHGRIEDRYEIGHHQEGLIDTARTLKDAKEIADRWRKSDTGYANPDSVKIYDSMARRNQITEWAVVDGNWQPIGLRVY